MHKKLLRLLDKIGNENSLLLPSSIDSFIHKISVLFTAIFVAEVSDGASTG